MLPFGCRLGASAVDVRFRLRRSKQHQRHNRLLSVPRFRGPNNGLPLLLSVPRFREPTRGRDHKKTSDAAKAGRGWRDGSPSATSSDAEVKPSEIRKRLPS